MGQVKDLQQPPEVTFAPNTADKAKILAGGDELMRPEKREEIPNKAKEILKFACTNQTLS